jgi:thiamine biosynthesis lipoprotein ApbE
VWATGYWLIKGLFAVATGKHLKIWGIGNDFLNKTPVAQEIRLKIETMGLHQVNRLEERTHKMGQNLCKLSSDKELISRIYRELKKLKTKDK